MGNPAKFWDKIAAKYAKSPIKNMEAYNATMDRTKAHLTEGDIVLEVGCGTGSTALLLADHVKHITATDLSSNMIEIGKAKAQDQQVENVSFVQATLSDETLEPGSFDVILAFNILHLLEDLPEALCRINELLKPEGRFISKSPCMAGHSKRMMLLSYLMPLLKMLGLVPYVRFMSVPELEELVTNENFQIVEAGEYPTSNRFIVARKT